MRILSFICFLLVLACSCGKDEDALTQIKGDSNINYKTSLKKWNERKASDNTYLYTISFTSWVGFGNETTISVLDGQVTGRSYYEFNEEMDTTFWYSETIDELNSHSEGAPPLTFDELYATCASEYLVVDEKENKIYFDTDAVGIMNLCGYVPYNCADDCFTGIKISLMLWFY